MCIRDRDGKDIDSLIPYLNKNAINWIQIHGFQNTEVIQLSLIHIWENRKIENEDMTDKKLSIHHII